MLQKLIVLACVATLVACSATGNSATGSQVQAFAQPDSTASRPVAATIVEAMAGGLIGGALGQNLGARERRSALEAEYRALEYTPAGQAVTWDGSGKLRGEVMAGAPYRVGSQDCRQYVHRLFAGEAARSARGAACRNADGSWTPLT